MGGGLVGGGTGTVNLTSDSGLDFLALTNKTRNCIDLDLELDNIVDIESKVQSCILRNAIKSREFVSEVNFLSE